jgi:hypothetical protein
MTAGLSGLMPTDLANATSSCQIDFDVNVIGSPKIKEGGNLFLHVLTGNTVGHRNNPATPRTDLVSRRPLL